MSPKSGIPSHYRKSETFWSQFRRNFKTRVYLFFNDSLTNEERRQQEYRTNAQRDLICRVPGTNLLYRKEFISKSLL